MVRRADIGQKRWTQHSIRLIVGEKARSSGGSILFVANTDWYLFNFRLNLIQAARDAGWNVGLACPNGAYAERLRVEGFTVHPVGFDSLRYDPISQAALVAQLSRVVSEVAPTVVHVFTLKSIFYSALATPTHQRIRFIGAITGMGHLFTTHSLKNRLARRPLFALLRRRLSLLDAELVFQNRHDRDEFLAGAPLPAERAHVIRGSGVDCERFRPPQQRESRHPPTLLFCGRLIAEKGIREYLHATRRLREHGIDFDSEIAGTPYPGNPSSLRQTEVDALAAGGTHRLLGHVEDMAPLFAQADIVVLPTYREGTPKALLEAIAAGCIVVTSDIPGCAGIVDEGQNGHFVPVGDAEALAERLEELLRSSPTTLRNMRARSRAIALERFSDREINAQTLALYR